MKLSTSVNHPSLSSIELKLDNHIKKITELQSLIEKEEAAVFECLLKKKDPFIQ